ncbi:MAG: hypothetical protein Pg6C_15980 [Treponemataceae bacterium]|nr:MAG: hypothetical protein Pg6C_15980 [Treponemataceae bacterium]
MKKRTIFAPALTLALATVIAAGAFAQEATIYFSGDRQGFVTVTKDSGGKITMRCPAMKDKKGKPAPVDFKTSDCPFLPEKLLGDISDSVWMVEGAVIIDDGNTRIYTDRDGYWMKWEKTGNTTIWTDSEGSWEKTVVDGNTTTRTKSGGWWSKAVVSGNTTTRTDSDGGWFKTVVDGNTTTRTRSGGWWSKAVVSGNTTTRTDSDGGWFKTVVSGDTTTHTQSNGGWEKKTVSGNKTTWMLSMPNLDDGTTYKMTREIKGSAKKGYSVFIELTSTSDKYDNDGSTVRLWL